MLKGILTISGQSGLYKLVSQGSKGVIIVESLVDGKRMPAYATSKVSALEEIAMFTEEGEIKLEDVLMNIFKYTNGQKSIDPKASTNDELKSYMDNILPNWNKSKVYPGDIKKLITWYNLLLSNGIITDKKEEEAKA